MKRISVVLGLAVLMAVFIVGPVSAKAVTETDKETFHLSNALEDCDGGEIVVDSIARIVVHTTTDENGGVHGFVNAGVHGVTAADANGETVHFVAQSHEGSNVVEFPSTGTSTGTFIQNWKQISSGPSDNRTITTFTHFTVNANGELTSSWFEVDIGCPEVT